MCKIILLFLRQMALVAIILIPYHHSSSAQTTSSLEQAIKQQQETAKTLENSLRDTLSNSENAGPQDTPPRVYIHAQSAQQPEAFRLRKIVEAIKLSGAQIVVPRLVTVDTGPSASQMRYFHKSEKDEASAIAGRLSDAIPNLQVLDLSAQYETSDKIRPRHYELWLGSTLKPQ